MSPSRQAKWTCCRHGAAGKGLRWVWCGRSRRNRRTGFRSDAQLAGKTTHCDTAWRSLRSAVTQLRDDAVGSEAVFEFIVGRRVSASTPHNLDGNSHIGRGAIIDVLNLRTTKIIVRIGLCLTKQLAGPLACHIYASLSQ